MAAYDLMMKDEQVLSFIFDESLNRITQITDYFNISLAPLSVWNERLASIRDLDMLKIMNRWLENRGIPASRIGAQKLLNQDTTSQEMVVATLGLSLTDHFWTKPKDSHLLWSEVNFFENDFDNEIGKALAGVFQNKALKESNPYDPSVTANGNLPKIWTIDDSGRRCLLKAGSGIIQQEPFNEVAACKLYEATLSSEQYVSYNLVEMDYEIFSSCPAMTSEELAFVSAKDIFYSRKSLNTSITLDNMTRASENLGIAGFRKSVENQIILDYILGNVDRHLGNFGALFKSDTQEFIKPAPIFDTGMCLFNTIVNKPCAIEEVLSNPFSNRQHYQLAYVEDYSGISLDNVRNVAEKCCEVLSFSTNRYMDNERLEFLHNFIQSGIETVSWVQANQKKILSLDNFERSNAILDYRNQAIKKLGSQPKFYPAQVKDLKKRPSPAELADL